MVTATTTPPVVELGIKTPLPTKQKASRKAELLKLRETAMDKGHRFGVLALDGELSRLK